MSDENGVAVDIHNYVNPQTHIPHHLMLGDDGHFHILCDKCVGKVKGKVFGISSDKCEVCGIEFVYGANKSEPEQLTFF